MENEKKSRSSDMQRQRQRDADAIQRWIDAGCPTPPAIYRTVWSDKRRDAPTVMFWIRGEFGKEGER